MKLFNIYNENWNVVVKIKQAEILKFMKVLVSTLKLINETILHVVKKS